MALGCGEHETHRFSLLVHIPLPRANDNGPAVSAMGPPSPGGKPGGQVVKLFTGFYAELIVQLVCMHNSGWQESP